MTKRRKVAKGTVKRVNIIRELKYNFDKTFSTILNLYEQYSNL